MTFRPLAVDSCSQDSATQDGTLVGIVNGLLLI